jgi:hypothetical protein
MDMKSFPCKVPTAAALLLIAFAPCNALGARVDRIPASDLVRIVIIFAERRQPNLVEQVVWLDGVAKSRAIATGGGWP